jgi:hypothetical protein
MSVRFHRRVALIAALFYALASSFSDLVHTHHGQRTLHVQGATTPTADARGGDSHGGDSHGGDSEGGDSHEGGSQNDRDDSCAACRFVIENSVLVLTLPEPGLGELTHELRPNVCFVFSTSVPTDCLARAPPAADQVT